MKLRSYLTALTLATLLPLAVFAAILGVYLLVQERETFRRGAEERTLALLTAVDAELRGSMTALQALAVVSSLQRDDLAGFLVVALGVLESQPRWLNINLALPNGRQILNLKAAKGTPLPNNRELDGSFDRVMRTGQPAVGDLVVGPVLKRWSFTVRAPVERDGRIVYVISAVVDPASMNDIIEAQHLDPGWVAVILDRNYRFVSRNWEPEKSLGQPASDSLRAALARASGGWFRGRTVEGREVYTPYRRSEQTGWVVAMGVPAAALDAAAWRAAAIFGVGLAGALAIALFLGWYMARRIAEPITALAEATKAAPGERDLEARSPERIDEIRRLYEAVQERSDLQEREKSALRAADRAKDEFLAMLSHELRNPLAALMTAAHVLKLAKPENVAAIKARAVVERQTKHMARLVGDLLDISRVAMGKVTLERERLDLAEVIGNLVTTWRASGRFERHVVALDLHAAWVDADRARIEQVVSNLLDNAVKFTPAGKPISVSVRPEGESAVVSVSDEGEGLAPGAAERMFELFVQGERGLDRGAGGLGVGLALVKRLTELHGGSVSAESAGPGRGATFSVRLPSVLAPVERAPAEKRTPAPPRDILIIEDNDDTRQMLHYALVQVGHNVREARDAASGLALATEARPDVALIDIGLPDLDGYELARRLRATPGGRRMGLIALTGYGQAEDQQRAYDAGFDAHLTKPVAPERLRQVMAGLP